MAFSAALATLSLSNRMPLAHTATVLANRPTTAMMPKMTAKIVRTREVSRALGCGSSLMEFSPGMVVAG
jgi:hypothetical protein